MAEFKNFRDIFSSLDKTVKKSADQAINRAGVSTRAKYAKDISAELGITSARAKSRAKLYKSTGDNPGQTLSIGVRTMFAAHDFKPKSKKVDTRLGKRFAATYQVKSQSRIQTAKGFIVQGKNSGKSIIIERKGDKRYPTATVMVNVFRPAVQALAPLLQKHMVDRFNILINSILKYKLGN